MNTPVFDILCLEYPELQWSQDVTVLMSVDGPVREIYGRLTTS